MVMKQRQIMQLIYAFYANEIGNNPIPPVYFMIMRYSHEIQLEYSLLMKRPNSTCAFYINA